MMYVLYLEIFLYYLFLDNISYLVIFFKECRIYRWEDIWLVFFKLNIMGFVLSY